ncbi:3(2),5-bisphosphate nucleotidase HAL2 [Nadsonia fulvescens var. elongata DSM 6958]|uniref:3'(2'),5'-bisphosphate nucleotidase n=1 Tax=Nadsonia fulvescens var. elongata DSM 6958 TaxID=857566 RepID=A0A1E3PNN5_9ASCO|nr:3(2),5-bisphosphate nucleotidase HAL2 [Nadsonia fulvescens var. elongata DSM 6958]
MAYAAERKVAELAVQRACRLAVAVADSNKNSTITKDDSSPVTVADFGCQATIIAAIKNCFSEDPVVGEEDSDALRSKDSLRERVWSLVQDAVNSGSGETETIGELTTSEAMLDAIDAGNYEGGNKGRMWALDPIDGTKGFIRHGQYAVCLALLVDSEVVVGVIGCPNLPVDPSNPEGETGVIFSAVKGQGAFQRALSSDVATPISFSDVQSTEDAVFCESVESGHSAHGTQSKIAELLNISKPSVRMDSQAKYCSIARGDGDIYLRLPVSDTYQEKIWDHASGNLLVSEAGGKVTDMFGNDLNFGVGRTLKNNKGVIAASNLLHQKVIDAVKQITSQN